jgi:hypothetical protein
MSSGPAASSGATAWTRRDASPSRRAFSLPASSPRVNDLPAATYGFVGAVDAFLLAASNSLMTSSVRSASGAP